VNYGIDEMIPKDNDTPVETYEKEYFGCKVKVWRIKGPYWGSHPWRFCITHNGKTHNFTGVPNYCISKMQALKRAWWRSRWLDSGEWDKHYT